MEKIKVTYCPILDDVCSRDRDQVLDGRRGLCGVDSSTSDCPAERRGYRPMTVDAVVVDGGIYVKTTSLIRGFLWRIREACDEIDGLLDDLKREIEREVKDAD